MVVAWDTAPIGVIDKTHFFFEYHVAQVLFNNTQYMYVCNRPPKSQSRPCSLKSVNMLIIMGMWISLGIWFKAFGIKEKCCMRYIPGQPLVYPFCHDSSLFWCMNSNPDTWLYKLKNWWTKFISWRLITKCLQEICNSLWWMVSILD